MSTPGRGRGYTGRHHLRDHRPGDADSDDLDAARKLAELSPRSTEPGKIEVKLTKELNSKPEKPIKEITEMTYNMSRDDEAALQELLKIDEQFTALLTLLEEFSPGEDGIQFNRKLRNFEATVTSMCPDEIRLQAAFCTFRAAALRSSLTARKLAAVGASFTRQQRQQLLRGALLNVVMEGTFSKLDVLERSHPIYLVNAANLLGDYFAEARLCNGNKVHILASPLVHYMRALLACDDIRAHRSLATQLMQNGRELLSVLSQELDELSIAIRFRLITPPPVSLIWLLLSADLCLNKFLPLPNSLQQFYASHLDLSADDNNFSEVHYGSWKKSPEKDEYNHSDVSSEGTDRVSHNLSQIGLNHDDGDNMRPKLRPILGAGAAKLRQEQTCSINQDSFDTWTPKSLAKRYDLNSWRQTEMQTEEMKKDEEPPVFNPTVLPPNLQNFPITVPDYPPPVLPKFNNFPQEKASNYVPQETGANFLPQEKGSHFLAQEKGSNFLQQEMSSNFMSQEQDSNYLPQDVTNNYLQQGDGAYIQNQYPKTTFTSQGDGFTHQYEEDENASNSEKVVNEVQKTNNSSNKKPLENWRKEKGELKEDSNKNKQKNWTQQRSKDNVTDDEEKGERYRPGSRNSRDGKVGNRLNRRNSSNTADDSSETGSTGKSQNRRHVTDVPRSQKYWDHDDRCDKDYNS